MSWYLLLSTCRDVLSYMFEFMYIEKHFNLVKGIIDLVLRVRINVSWFVFHFFAFCFSFIQFSFFTPSLKITKPKINIKKEKVFFRLLISIPMRHVLWEQICCYCIYTKTERNRSHQFKETTHVVKLLSQWSASKCNDIQE